MNIDLPENQDFKFIITNLYTRPKWFFRFTQEHWYNKYAWLLLYLALLGSQFGRISSGKLNIESWTELFFKVVIFGSGISLLFYIMFAYILAGTARWLKDIASAADILRVIAYSSIPGIIVLLLYIIGSLIYGISFFSISFWVNNESWSQTIFKIFLMTINGFVGINIAIFMVLGIATVNNFSIWKAILSMILPVIILVVVFAVIASFL